MTASGGGRPAADSAWYTRWFGEEYLQIYPHRDEAEAQSAVSLVLRHAGTGPDARVLDLACGAGRHLREFRRNGVRAIGLDLSHFLLLRAAASGAPLVRGDMRALPIGTATCDLVTNFFTSFGYFADAQEDLQVLHEVSRILRPGGAFAFDFLNADHVRGGLPSRDEKVVEGRSVVQVRSLTDDGRTVEKRIEILGPADPIPHIFYERVRLYSQAELTEMLAISGLRVLHRFGSYSGEPPGPDAQRVILIGRAL
jgi:SAM-dependent methyltransferase